MSLTPKTDTGPSQADLEEKRQRRLRFSQIREVSDANRLGVNLLQPRENRNRKRA